MTDFKKKAPFFHMMQYQGEVSALNGLYTIHQELGGDQLEGVEDHFSNYNELVDLMYDDGWNWREIEESLGEDERRALSQQIQSYVNDAEPRREMLESTVAQRASEHEEIQETLNLINEQYEQYVDLLVPGEGDDIDFSGVNQRLDSIESSIQDIDRGDEAVVAAFYRQAYSAVVAAAEGNIDDLEDIVDDLDDNLDIPYDELLDTIEGAAVLIDSYGDNVSDVNDKVDEVNTRIEQIRDKAADLKDQAENMQLTDEQKTERQRFMDRVDDL